MDEAIHDTPLRHVPDPTPEELAQTPLPRCFDLQKRYVSPNRRSPAAVYIRHALTVPPLRQAQTDRLAQRQDAGRIIMGHLDLPFFIADEREAYSLLDQLEAGNRGLIEAAERYCRQRPDTPFAIWAVWWIRKSLAQYRREVCFDPPSEWARIAASVLRLTYKLHRVPDTAEIVDDSGLSEENVRLMLGKYYDVPPPDYGAAEGLSPDQVCDVFNAARREAYLSTARARHRAAIRRRRLQDFVDGDNP